jgi:hypothetical protein
VDSSRFHAIEHIEPTNLGKEPRKVGQDTEPVQEVAAVPPTKIHINGEPLRVEVTPATEDLAAPKVLSDFGPAQVLFVACAFRLILQSPTLCLGVLRCHRSPDLYESHHSQEHLLDSGIGIYTLVYKAAGTSPRGE